MIRAHFDSVKARLEEDPVLKDSVFGEVIDPTRDSPRPERYVNLFMDNGHRTATRVTGPQAHADFTLTVHSVGQSRVQAQAVAEHVFTQLLGYVPSVPGRRCWRIRHDYSRPLDMDSSTQPTVYFIVDQFTLESDPTA